jgi:hemerythrin-like domain-containing protein
MTRDQLVMSDLTHRAMRRHSRALPQVLGAVRPGDVAAARQLAAFWSEMRVQIVHHHAVEDTIFFPGLLDAAPELAGVVEGLGDDHRALDAAMDSLSARLEVLGRTHVASGARLAAMEAATLVADLLDDHLDREDGATVPPFLAKVTASDYTSLTEQAIAHADSKALPFGAAWVLAHATPAEAEQLYAVVPSIVKLMYKVFWRRTYERSYPLMVV